MTSPESNIKTKQKPTTHTHKTNYKPQQQQHKSP